MKRIDALTERIARMGADVPRLLAVATVLILAFTGLLIILPRDQATFLIVIVLLVAPIPGWGAVAYLWRVYLADTSRPRSWLLLLVAFVATVIKAALLPVTYLAFAVILPDIKISGDDATLMLGVALMGAATVPVLLGLVIAARRRGKLGAPPPMEDE